ncbi:MAG: hypothetical protein ABI689_13645 [Thermoanaerobaculia bacterium]
MQVQPRTTLQDSLEGRRRILGFVALALVALLLLSWRNKGSLPSPTEIDPALLLEPLQEATERQPFEFAYKGHSVRVRPVAEYELWGLVVSHNNIQSLADIYHDSSSIDTKDLCVVWGSNLQSGELGKVEFESGPWTCYYRYPQGVRFVGSQMSNNHLVTDDEDLRSHLDDIRVGDQIHVKGALVDYQVDDWRDFWRRSSRVRTDGGNGACEVLYFEELEVLVPGTPFWYRLFKGTLLLLALVTALFLHSYWVDSMRLANAARREPAFDGAAPNIWPGGS